MDNNPDLVFTVGGESLHVMERTSQQVRREKKHQSVEGVKRIEGSEVRGRYQAEGLCGLSPVGCPGAYLVSISQLQTGDDLAFQL